MSDNKFVLSYEMIDSFVLSERIIGHLAWPIVVGFVAIVFRKPLLDLLQRMRAFSFGSAKLDFNNKIDDLEKKITSDENDDSKSRTVENFEIFKDVDPAIILLNAWIDLEKTIERSSNLFSELGIRKNNRDSVQTLLQNEIIDRFDSMQIDELRGLRNKVVHGVVTDLNKSQAVIFAQAAQQIKDRIEARAGKKNVKGVREPG